MRLSPQTRARPARQEASPAPAVPCFTSEGGVFDLVQPTVHDIDFADMAAGLSKIARFNGAHRGPAYSVAQHSVMGADALFVESGDSMLAGYFLLHDGHEYKLGDWTRPAVDALIHHALAYCGADDRTAGLKRFMGEAIRNAVEASKAAIDRAVWQAACLPDIEKMPLYARQVRDMDNRMLRAEGRALFGPKAIPHLPAAGMAPPRLTGPIRPWAPMKAEEEFAKRLSRYLNIVVRETF